MGKILSINNRITILQSFSFLFLMITSIVIKLSPNGHRSIASLIKKYIYISETILETRIKHEWRRWTWTNRVGNRVVKIPHGSRRRRGGAEGWHKLQSAEKRRGEGKFPVAFLTGETRGWVIVEAIYETAGRVGGGTTSNFSPGRNALPSPLWKKNAISCLVRGKGRKALLPLPPLSWRSISPNVRCVSRTKGCCANKGADERKMRPEIFVVTKMDGEGGWHGLTLISNSWTRSRREMQE